MAAALGFKTVGSPWVWQRLQSCWELGVSFFRFFFPACSGPSVWHLPWRRDFDWLRWRRLLLLMVLMAIFSVLPCCAVLCCAVLSCPVLSCWVSARKGADVPCPAGEAGGSRAIPLWLDESRAIPLRLVETERYIPLWLPSLGSWRKQSRGIVAVSQDRRDGRAALTRAKLMADIEKKGLLGLVSPEVRQIYALLESGAHPPIHCFPP